MVRIDLRSWGSTLGATLALTLATLALGCGVDGGSLADNGGMSGTGISQGPITAFGSIFVNGVEWSLGGASIEIDGARGDESQLRRGMVVRVRGDFAADGLSGHASSVVFDPDLEGPIADDPVELDPAGIRKSFTVLDTLVIVHSLRTVFDGGASFDGLARDQVVQVSGFADGQGRIQATRVAQSGSFPDDSSVELSGQVANLFQDSVGGGVFDLGAVVVRYTAATSFGGGTRGDLANGQAVDVKGQLRLSGDEVDASRIELEGDPFAGESYDQFALEGFVGAYVSDADFRIAGVRVDASGAELMPATLVLANGVQVEVDGRLENGILIADTVQGQGDDAADANANSVLIQAAVTARTTRPNTVTLLGVTVSVDNDSELMDQLGGAPHFRFRDIAVGDWLEADAVPTGAATARAVKLARRAAAADAVLQGPVSDLDPDGPALEVLGVGVVLDGATQYRDAGGQARSEDEFFRNPGDVMLDDVVRVIDADAADPSALGVADRVELGAAAD